MFSVWLLEKDYSTGFFVVFLFGCLWFCLLVDCLFVCLFCFCFVLYWSFELFSYVIFLGHICSTCVIHTKLILFPVFTFCFSYSFTHLVLSNLHCFRYVHISCILKCSFWQVKIVYLHLLARHIAILTGLKSISMVYHLSNNAVSVEKRYSSVKYSQINSANYSGLFLLNRNIFETSVFQNLQIGADHLYTK